MLEIQSKQRFVRKDHRILKGYSDIFKIQSKIFLLNILTNGLKHVIFSVNIYVRHNSS